MAGTSDLLELTITMTSSTVIAAGVAGFMPHLIGDEPNPVVGIRTKATLSSPEAWQLAHQVAQPILRRTAWTAVVGMLVQVVIGVVTGFGSVASAVAAVVVCVTAFIVLIYAAFKGNAAAKALER
ncbi:SdpI family protein [Prescottella agglutinans]|uniref:SdpI family protein n=1 Tax=Prescottella agglutinans TaxID=1644129 RepID=UPI002474536F|nr:SdpI family protein [Prescottella agglutinans]